MNQNIWKGVLAGAVAGLVATAIKTVWEEALPARPANRDSPPVVLAERAKEEAVGENLTKSEKPIVEKSLHWAFGTSIGAVYGGVVEVLPATQKGLGGLLGTALYGVTHGSVLPMMNTEPWPLKQPLKFATSEFASHILYGVVVEFTRRQVRGWLDKK